MAYIAQERGAAAERPQLVPDLYAADLLPLCDFDDHKIRQTAIYTDRLHIRQLYRDAASGGDTVYEKQLQALYNARSLYNLVGSVDRVSLHLNA